MTKLLAFHGDKKIKAKYEKRLVQHHKMDQIIQGTGYEKKRNRGCAVGCTLNNYNHKAYETELGVPQVLARIEDRIFENLPSEEAPDFAVNFLKSIPVGADLQFVAPSFVAWLMQDILDRPRKKELPTYVKDAILLVQGLCSKQASGEKVSLKTWQGARDITYKARRDAAAAYAAYAAAAYAAADAAAYAAAADDAADAACAACAACAAAANARKEFWKRSASKLLELLAAAPIPVQEVAK